MENTSKTEANLEIEKIQHSFNEHNMRIPEREKHLLEEYFNGTIGDQDFNLILKKRLHK